MRLTDECCAIRLSASIDLHIDVNKPTCPLAPHMVSVATVPAAEMLE
jgi:hypothetical protein